jgi:histidinol-phosphatase (PHP family)
MIDTSIDGHVHTKLCHHASGEMEEFVLAAVNKNLRKIVFLEHLEVGIDYFESTWLSENDFDIYHEEGKRLRDKYKNTIEIDLGIEVGYNPKYLNEIQRRLALHSWDQIGISYHFLETNSGHLNMVSSKQINIDRLDQVRCSVTLMRSSAIILMSRLHLSIMSLSMNFSMLLPAKKSL